MNLDERKHILNRSIALKNVIRDRLMKQAAMLQEEEGRIEMRNRVARWSELEEMALVIKYDVDRANVMIPLCTPDERGERRKEGLSKMRDEQSAKLEEILAELAEVQGLLGVTSE